MITKFLRRFALFVLHMTELLSIRLPDGLLSKTAEKLKERGLSPESKTDIVTMALRLIAEGPAFNSSGDSSSKDSPAGLTALSPKPTPPPSSQEIVTQRVHNLALSNEFKCSFENHSFRKPEKRGDLLALPCIKEVNLKCPDSTCNLVVWRLMETLPQ